MDLERGHKQSRNKSCAAVASDEDVTLDIVRLLVETESRREDTHSDGATSASYLSNAAGKAAPMGHVQPRRAVAAVKARHPQVPEQRAVAESAPQAQPVVEDLRPTRLGLKTPQLRLPSLSFLKNSRRKDKDQAKSEPPKPEAIVERKSPKAGVDRSELAQYFKLAALVGGAILVIFKPWLIPLVLFILIWLALIMFLLMGSARVSEIATSVWNYYSSKNAASAERYILKIQSAADRVDGLLARLPESWVDGVYSPDLGRSERDLHENAVYELKDDPFDRLCMQTGQVK